MLVFKNLSAAAAALLLLVSCASAYLSSPLEVRLEGPIHPKAFSGSPPLLQSLAGKEEVIYELLKDLAADLTKVYGNNVKVDGAVQGQIKNITTYLQYYENTTGSLKGNYSAEHVPLRAHLVSWDPIASYHMLRRFSRDLKNVLRSLDQNDENSLRIQNMILSIMDEFGWPTEEDFNFLKDGILRIQSVYDLTVDEIAGGHIKNHTSNVKLSANDCHEIGLFALKKRQYAWAVEWLEKAQELAKEDPRAKTAEIEKDLKKSISEHDKHWAKTEGWEPEFYDKLISDVPINRHKRRNTQFDFYKGVRQPNMNHINFWGLCSGENYQRPEEQVNLRCWYETKRTPYLTISPVKSELLSEHPVIVQYYDVLTPKWIEKIQSSAARHLARSTVVDESSKFGASKTASSRTSLNSWIADFYLDEFKELPHIVHSITGMNVYNREDCEELQVASYAFGGHYDVHMDALKQGLDVAERGDRIATFMFYLTDVEVGGATAFPIVGIAAKPIKGSAVYWNNILSSGYSDERTWHGACPVIMGEKWVANKWIRLHGQFPQHTCHPKNYPIPYEVNGVPIEF